MATKTLDVDKAVNREYKEPKLKGKKVLLAEDKKREGAQAFSSQPFEIRLKRNSRGEDVSLTLKSIDPGMTKQEVIEVAGKPWSIEEWYTGNMRFNYGNAWVVFENGRVSCLVYAEHYRKYWGREAYEKSKPEALIR